MFRFIRSIFGKRGAVVACGSFAVLLAIYGDRQVLGGEVPLSMNDPVQPMPLPLDVPADYHGPIDPQWPPSRAMDLEAELSASRLVLAHLEADEGGKFTGKPLITVDTSSVHAEEGHIGGFDYIEVVLGVTSPIDEPLPLVVLLHGRGGKPTIPTGPYLTERALRLLIPRGPDRLGEGYNWLATWTNSGNEELLSRSLAGRVDQLMPAIAAFAHLKATLGKPMVVGFSQGAILAYGLAIRYPERFSAIFPIAGWLPPSLATNLPLSDATKPLVYALHGGSDFVVPTEKGRATAQLFQGLRYQVEYTEISGVGHAVTPQMNELVRSWVRNECERLQVVPEKPPLKSNL